MEGSAVTSTAKAFDDPGTPEEISRRKFLAGASVVMGGIVGLGVAIPCIASLIPTEEIIAGSKSWSPLNADEMKQLQASTDKPIKIFFTHHIKDGYVETDEQDYVWGVKLKPADIPKLKSSRPDLPDLKVVAQGIAPYPAVVMGFVMFSSICPHLGCRYNWDPSANKFACPCHGSQFTALGEHVAGPAPRGLDPLPLQEKSGVAEITWIRYKQGEPDRVVVSYT
jgi:Rieske Fe-S protein